MTQSTPLAGKIRYLLAPRPFIKEDTKVERIGPAVVVSPLFIRRPKVTGFRKRYGDDDHESIWGYVLSSI